MWEKAEGSLKRALDAEGRGLPAQPGRRRVLRAQDRLPHPRRAQALLAVRHHPARLLHAGALRPHLRGRRRSAAHARDAASRGLRQHRALPGHHHRELRGCVPALALAGAGHGDPDQREVRRLRQRDQRQAARPRAAQPGQPERRPRRLQDPRGQLAEAALRDRGRREGAREPHASTCARATRASSAR